MDYLSLINKHYENDSRAKEILLEHSSAVSRKALKIGQKLQLPKHELEFIHEGCMIHDIGIYLTHAPAIGCFGEFPYICHGYLGHDLMAREGFPIHALVCERHTGTGLNINDIINQNLPIPRRSMEAVSLAEKIICYADKFFSKNPGKLGTEDDLEHVRKKILKYGAEKLEIFDSWHRELGK